MSGNILEVCDIKLGHDFEEKDELGNNILSVFLADVILWKVSVFFICFFLPRVNLVLVKSNALTNRSLYLGNSDVRGAL